MKSVKLRMFLALAVLFATPSLAQSFGANPLSAAASPVMLEHTSSVVYKNAVAESHLAGILSVNQTPGLGEGMNTSLKVRFFRPDSLSMTNSQSDMIIRNDRASFTLNAPMPAVNGALSFMGTIYQTPLDSSATKWIQVLSLIATRRINAEFGYTAQIDKSSRLDTVIAYKRHPVNDLGKSSDVVASFQYSAKF